MGGLEGSFASSTSGFRAGSGAISKNFEYDDDDVEDDDWKD